MKNKKILIITSIIIISLVIISVLAIIKLKDKNVVDEKATKTYGALIENTYSEEYYAKYKIINDYEKDSLIIEVAKKDNKVYVKQYINEKESLNLIYTDPLTFTIDNNNKTYSITEGKTKQVESASRIFLSSDTSMTYTELYETGEEEIDGLEYQYEKFKDNEGKIMIAYFNENGLKYVKYIEQEIETTIEILNFSKTIDDNLFIVPVGYTYTQVNQ